METLAARIAREGPVNELDAVGWIVRLAKKLETLHARGLAHGGISPEALKTASASRLSLGMLVPTGATRNRLEFRSPERVDTEASSAADDTWSTAATLYTLITGSSPFVGSDDDAIGQKIRSGTFAPLSAFEVGDDDLQHVIEAALNPSLANRMSSMAAFREALEAWHPDRKVRDLPPVVDDQPDDDEDECTVLRPVSAADAVRAIVTQREQASAVRPAELARRGEEPAHAARKAPAPPPVVPAHQPPPVAGAHGLLEDDDENAKTSLISVPPIAMFGSRAPVTVPASPPVAGGFKSTPPPATASPATGFNMMRAPGGPAARQSGPGGPARKNLAKQTVVGGFAVKPAVEPLAPPVASPPLPPPPPVRPTAISREALLEDADDDATVMREAPAEVMRQAKSSIAPPAHDRKTPVDPTSAAVAAATEGSAVATGGASPSSAFADPTNSLFDDYPDTDKEVEPRETPASPLRGQNAAALLGDASLGEGQSSSAAMPSPAVQAPAPPHPSIPLAPAMPAIVPSTPAALAPSTPSPGPRPSAPAAVPGQPTVLPGATLTSTNAARPNALMGMLVGVGVALLIIAAVAGVYFFVLKP